MGADNCETGEPRVASCELLASNRLASHQENSHADHDDGGGASLQPVPRITRNGLQPSSQLRLELQLQRQQLQLQRRRQSSQGWRRPAGAPLPVVAAEPLACATFARSLMGISRRPSPVWRPRAPLTKAVLSFSPLCPIMRADMIAATPEQPTNRTRSARSHSQRLLRQAPPNVRELRFRALRLSPLNVGAIEQLHLAAFILYAVISSSNQAREESAC